MRVIDISDWVANYFPGSQSFRDKRAKELVEKLTGFVRINRGDNVVDLGAGHGEPAAEMARHGCRIMCVDLYTSLSKKVGNSKVKGNMIWIQGDVTKKIASLEDNSADLVTIFYLLQALDEEGKKTTIKKAARIVKEYGNIVIIDEIPRKFWNSWDTIVHFGLNLAEKSKKYNILEQREYKQLFLEAGLSVNAEGKYGNHVLYVLQKNK